MSRTRVAKFNELIGKTLTSVTINGDKTEVEFIASDGSKYRMFHPQDCCEYVSIEEIIGDIKDLVGAPIAQAEEVVSDNEGECSDSCTWTFYKLGTTKGRVTFRWLGESNGYYSEAVNFCQTKKAA